MYVVWESCGDVCIKITVELVWWCFPFYAAGEAKNLGPVSGPNRQRDLCTFCTISLDQEEVFRTKVFDKSVRYVSWTNNFLHVLNEFKLNLQNLSF